MKFKRTYLCYTLRVFLSAVWVLALVACGGGNDDPAPTQKDEVVSILTSGTWRVQTVTVDGTDQTDVYQGMTLRFTSSNYTATNGIPVWVANGTWTFTDDSATSFRRGDGVEVRILNITQSSLRLGLVWDETTIGSGRVESIAGDHIFSFVK